MGERDVQHVLETTPRGSRQQVKILYHTRPDELQRKINDWLRNCIFVKRVQGVTLSHAGGFHYATILYTELDT